MMIRFATPILFACLVGYVQAEEGTSVASAAPEVLVAVAPVYPAIAAAAHVQGTVVIDLTVDASGRPGDLKVLSGPKLLEESALRAARRWEWRRASERRSAEVVFEYVLVPENTCTEKTLTRFVPPNRIETRQRGSRTTCSDCGPEPSIDHEKCDIGDVQEEEGSSLAPPSPDVAVAVAPMYPAIAAAARVEGTVVIDMTIDARGRPSELKVLSGPRLLEQSALEAAQRWAWRRAAEKRSARVVFQYALVPDAACMDYQNALTRFGPANRVETRRLSPPLSQDASDIASPPPDSYALSEVAIEVGRLGCLGDCPEYSITLHGNGTGEYKGTSKTRVRGSRSFTVPAERLELILRALYDIRFFELSEGDLYPRHEIDVREGGRVSVKAVPPPGVVLDAEELTVQVTVGSYKRALHSSWTSLAATGLWEFAAYVDRTVGSDHWTGRKRR
jgi:TonB family protein